MLNAEKYKDEIVKVGYDFALFANKPIVACYSDEYECDTCKFHNDFTGCRAKRIKWLLEEYKEPLLSDKEKAYLKNVIEPFGDYVAYVSKFATSKLDFLSIYISVNEEKVRSFEIPLMYDLESMFKNIKYDKEYTLEELDL